MALNPYAKPFIFKRNEQAVPFRCDGFAPSAIGPLGTDLTVYATNAKLERLTLEERPLMGPQVDKDATESRNAGHSRVPTTDPTESEELTFDDVFDHDVADEEAFLSMSRAQVRCRDALSSAENLKAYEVNRLS